jgi:hypothetical protein
LVASLTGLSFGPLIVGLINDHIAAQFGPAAIRYSMLIASFSSSLCGIAILLAGRTWRRDVALAQDR